MTIYVVLHGDHHTDTEVHLFSTSEAAIACAQQIVNDNWQDDSCAELCRRTPPMIEAGWLWFGCYSQEGDCGWVLPREVDAPP